MMWWTRRRILRGLDELVDGHKDFRYGLCFIGYGHGLKLGYRLRGGFGYRWLPMWAMRVITRVWNLVACRVWGHDELDEGALGIASGKVVCVNCCKVLR